MADFRDAHDRIRPAIVGLGIRNGDDLEIFGTGFIINDSGVILTNRHVLEPMLEGAPTGTRIRQGACGFFFTPGPESKTHAMQQLAVMQIHRIDLFDDQPRPSSEPPIPPPNLDVTLLSHGTSPAADVAICGIPLSQQSAQPSVPVTAASVVNSRNVRVGTEVGMLGFPLGLPLALKDPATQSQFSPLLQVGVIAGILPFPQVPQPHAFMLALAVNGGSSGSPLFLSDGTVVGVVYARRRHLERMVRIDPNTGQVITSPNEDLVDVRTSLGFAGPTASFPSRLKQLLGIE